MIDIGLVEAGTGFPLQLLLRLHVRIGEVKLLRRSGSYPQLLRQVPALLPNGLVVVQELLSQITYRLAVTLLKGELSSLDIVSVRRIENGHYGRVIQSGLGMSRWYLAQ